MKNEKFMEICFFCFAMLNRQILGPGNHASNHRRVVLSSARIPSPTKKASTGISTQLKTKKKKNKIK